MALISVQALVSVLILSSFVSDSSLAFFLPALFENRVFHSTDTSHDEFYRLEVHCTVPRHVGLHLADSS